MKLTIVLRWTRLYGRKGVPLAAYTVVVVFAITALLRPHHHRSRFLAKNVLSLPPLNNNLPIVGQFNAKNWHSNPLLPRRIRQAHYPVFIDLLRRVDQVFRKWNIPYMMNAGTLIGSYFHHDMIPWDDDVDLVADFLRRKDMIAAFKSMGHPYRMYERTDYFKIYRADGVRIRNLPWRWPSLDIFRFASDGVQMWGWHKLDKSFPLSAVVPLTLRPFGPLWLPAPNNVMTVLAIYYGFNSSDDSSRSCLSNAYIHIKESHVKRHEVQCSRLRNSYPFVVSREPTGDGLIVETLSIAKVAVQQVAIPAASPKRP